VAFRGRSAIVTGGASGIGLALGARLAELGALVVLADIDGELAEQSAAALGDGVEGRRLDVTDLTAFGALVDEVADRDGAIDYLFNNAGISLGGPTHDLTAAHWDRIIDVNLRGVANGILAVYPRMVQQGHGHIISTASGAGLFAPPFVAAYSATKFAVVGLSQSLRPEAALHGVKVSVLCPGAVDTPLLDRSGPADLPPPSTQALTGREYLTLLGQKPVPAKGLAGKALAQVARNKAVIMVPAAAKLPWYLNRWSPALGRAISNAAARRVQRRLPPA